MINVCKFNSNCHLANQHCRGMTKTEPALSTGSPAPEVSACHIVTAASSGHCTSPILHHHAHGQSVSVQLQSQRRSQPACGRPQSVLAATGGWRVCLFAVRPYGRTWYSSESGSVRPRSPEEVRSPTQVTTEVSRPTQVTGRAQQEPTRSRGISRSSEPCFRNTVPAGAQSTQSGHSTFLNVLVRTFLNGGID